MFAIHTVSLLDEDRALLVGLDLYVSLRAQQNPKCERAVRLVYLSFFCELPQTKTELDLEIQRAVSR